VHAWEEWGEDCVQHFRGMFAFAIWDRNQRTLFLARDRLGIKPLYYAELNKGIFIFASELKALLIYPGLQKNLDPHAVEEYFTFGYVPEPRTILRQVQKLQPGYILTLACGHPVPAPKKYWDIPFGPLHVGTEEDISRELVERLREAVKIRLVSEVPLGAFLSGGVDSSAVVSMMAGLSPETPVNTCAIGFSERQFNEAEFAAMVAKQYGTNHYMETVGSDDFDLLDVLAGMYDEPYADSSAIPTYRVCELARKKVTVALSGDGSDECFAGYRRHRWHMLEERIRSLLPQTLRMPLFGMLGKYYPKIDWAPRVLRAKTTFQALARDSVSAYLHTVSLIDDSLRNRLFSRDFHNELQGYTSLEVFKYHADQAPTEDPLALIQYLDLKTYLPGDILTKVDRASMAHSLEVRVPLLDHEFVEWVSCLPSALKLQGSEGKYILKHSLKPYLPQEILYRQKMGFSVPLAAWFRGPLRQRVRNAVLGDTLKSTGIFNEGCLHEIVEQHQAGMRDYSAAIWSLLMFEAFQRNINEQSVRLN